MKVFKVLVFGLSSAFALSSGTLIHASQARPDAAQKQFNCVKEAAKTIRNLSNKKTALSDTKSTRFAVACNLISDAYGSDNVAVINFINEDADLLGLANVFDTLREEIESVKALAAQISTKSLVVDDAENFTGACTMILDMYRQDNPYVKAFINCDTQLQFILNTFAKSTEQEGVGSVKTTLSLAQQFAKQLMDEERQRRLQQRQHRR